jgi:DNA helicase-2/ATP-dependent DNA helicase PcrA
MNLPKQNVYIYRHNKNHPDMDPFYTILNALNAQQKKAVECIEGPVMVIAGPGTGKTQILAARIANILLKTDTHPENILCMTFTDAGAVAMRQRLASFIGPDAYRLNIHTFHSFCNAVIQQNKEAFDHIDWQAASDIEKHEIMRTLLDELKPNHPLRKFKGNVYQDVNPLLKLFSLMKRERISVDEIIFKCNAKKEEALSDPEFRYKRKSGENNVGDLKQKDLDQLYNRLDQLMAAANLRNMYSKKMNAAERYDFDDMIGWVIDLFEQRPDVLTRYQEKYLYILVDEFQDTNGSQYQIIRKLSEFWEDNPNLFAVGDDDQSIYRFQGAEIGNITSFYQYYNKHLTTVLLENNYRSGQAILDAAGQVISHNSERLVNQMEGIYKNLKASNPQIIADAKPPKVRVLKNPYAESVHLGQEIKQLVDQKVHPHDIAIIYRKHSQADELIRYFTDLNIPFNLIRRENVLDNPIVAKFILLLNYLHAEMRKPFSGGNLLFRILHYSEFKHAPTQLAILQRKAAENRMNIREFVFSDLNQSIQNRDALSKVRDTIESLDHWLRFFQEQTVVEATGHLLNESGFLRQMLKTPNKERNLEAIRTFFDFMKAEAERNKKLSLTDFLETLEMMETYHLDLPMQTLYGHENGVNLMTAHGAKGLEFEHVYVMGCTEAHWEKNRVYDRFSLEQIYPNLKDENAIEESRRLFYVALTRAKKQLNVSYYENETNGKDVSPSRFVVEMIECKSVQQEEVHVPDHLITEFMLSYVPPDQTGPITLPEQAFMDSFLKDYSLSVTHLNTYLKCPISFYFNQVLRVPAAKNSAMSFGSAIHGVLEKIFTEYIKKGKTPSEIELLNLFEKQMFAYSSGFTDKDLKHLTEYGKSFIHPYILSRKEMWQSFQSFEIEKNIHTRMDDIPINGKLDRVSLNGQKVWVSDYKTGSVDNKGRKLDPPREGYEEEDPELRFGGDYWRQIMFYKILIDADPNLSWQMTAGEIDFVEPDKNGNFKSFTIDVSQSGVTQVKEQIKTVYAKILNREFSTGCNDEYCQWCKFVQAFDID